MLRAVLMSGQPMYSPEARQLALKLLLAVLEASKAHPDDDAVCRAAASVTREQLVCRVIDQHGYDQGKVIVNDARELSQRLVDVLAEHWGLPLPAA